MVTNDEDLTDFGTNPLEPASFRGAGQRFGSKLAGSRRMMCSAITVLVILAMVGCDEAEGTLPDGGADGGPQDGAASLTDAGASDAGSRDAGPADAGPADAGPADAGPADAGPRSCPMGGPCEGEYNYAFLTSTEHTGDLGGLAGADAICNALAAAAGLPGTYVAWLSDSTRTAAERLGTANGWVRVDRRPFAISAEDLHAGRLVHPLIVDETGHMVRERSIAFTGTTREGASSPWTCSDWTSNGDQPATSGAPYRGSSALVASVSNSCSNLSRLYCLGVDHARPLPATPESGRLAFLTSDALPSGSGLTGMDGQCQADAQAAGHTGSFIAFLATTTTTAASRLTPGEQWVRVDGVPIWDTVEGAMGGTEMEVPVSLRLDGTAYRPTGPADSSWLGAESFSTLPSVFTACLDWTSSDASDFSVRINNQSVLLRDRSSASCDRSYPVICLEL